MLSCTEIVKSTTMDSSICVRTVHNTVCHLMLAFIVVHVTKFKNLDPLSHQNLFEFETLNIDNNNSKTLQPSSMILLSITIRFLH